MLICLFLISNTNINQLFYLIGGRDILISHESYFYSAFHPPNATKQHSNGNYFQGQWKLPYMGSLSSPLTVSATSWKCLNVCLKRFLDDTLNVVCVITISYSTQTLKWDIHGKLLITTSWIYTTVTPQTVQLLAILLQHYCICIIIDYQVSVYRNTFCLKLLRGYTEKQRESRHESSQD